MQASARPGVLGAGGVVGRVSMGMVADRIGNKFSMIISSTLMLVSLLWLLLAKDLWMLYLFGVIFGLGHGGMATMESPMVAKIFGMRSHGVLLGFVFFADTIGGAISPVVAGYIFDAMGGYYLAFVLAVVIGAVNLTLVWLLKPIRSVPTNE